jgi:hypothetical protein
MRQLLLLALVGVFAGGTTNTASGQLNVQATRPAPRSFRSPERLSVSSALIGEGRKPFAALFKAQVDAKPTPVPRGRGPCGIVIFDYRQGADPRMVVPIAPGEFAVRRVVPDTCSSQ